MAQMFTSQITDGNNQLLLGPLCSNMLTRKPEKTTAESGSDF